MNISISLDIYEGPLDFLIYLIQKKEIEASAVSLQRIIEQYQISGFALDTGSEFIGFAASLLLLKSKFLLPLNDSLEIKEEDIADPKFDMIHHLVDYCRFKQAAKELSQLEYQQNGLYARGHDATIDPKKMLGIEHLTLEDLASLFQQVLSRIKVHQGTVCDEDWKVADKIVYLRDTLKRENELEFSSLFSESMNKLEVIALFLAILELMKAGELCVVKINTDNYRIIKK